MSEKERPTEWQDDQKMSVLFSPFRSREVNPKSYEKKLDFWRNLIHEEAKKKNVVSFNTSELPKMFERKGKMPHCLDTVIADMLGNKKIMKVEEFRSEANLSWVSWGINLFVKKPLSWTYSSLFKSSSNQATGDYVILDLVKEMSADMLQKLHNDELFKEGIITYKDLRFKFNDLDELTLQLVLTQLQKEQKIATHLTDTGEKVIKFATTENSKVATVTEAEIKTHRLNSVVPLLEHQIRQLRDDMKKCRQDAKQLLSQGLKSSAKNCLRRKKILEGVLQKRENALENVHTLIGQIKDADTNRMILDAYAAGTSAYKEKVKDMTPESIDNVMIDLEETLDIQSEIESAMSQGVKHPDDVSMSELEQELDDILAAESPAAQTETGDIDDLLQGIQNLTVNHPEEPKLPDVPKFDPVVIQARSTLRESSPAGDRAEKAQNADNRTPTDDLKQTPKKTHSISEGMGLPRKLSFPS